MIVCIRCGEKNEEGQKYCQKCKSLLLPISESVAGPPPERINIHYNQLKEASEKILANGLSPEEFVAVLDRIYAKISTHLQEIHSMEIPEDIRATFDEQLELGVSGIHHFLQGIDEMRLYVQDSDPEHIKIGMELSYSGNEELNDALDMARENIRKLKDMGIESEFDTRDKPL